LKALSGSENRSPRWHSRDCLEWSASGAPDGWVTVNRRRVIALAAQQNVPAVYHNQGFARDTGLRRCLCGSRPRWRKARTFRFKIPAKFLMLLNAKTAKALGLDFGNSQLQHLLLSRCSCPNGRF
jgi:hypothetical protein